VTAGTSPSARRSASWRCLTIQALPSWERKGTDTLHFNLTKGGIETFTEAYHESGSNDDGKNIWTIRYYRTFVATEDGVRSDREVIVFPFLECQRGTR